MGFLLRVSLIPSRIPSFRITSYNVCYTKLLRDQFSIRVKQSQDWFAIDGEITIDEKQKMSIQQLLDKSKGGTLKYIQLDETTYLSICADLLV